MQWLKAHHVDVVLAGLQFVERLEQDDHYRAVRDLMRKIAAEENVIMVRRYEAMRLLTQAEASGGGLIPTNSSATKRATPAWRSTWRERSRLGFSGAGCGCARRSARRRSRPNSRSVAIGHRGVFLLSGRARGP